MKLKHLLGTDAIYTFVFVDDASCELTDNCPVYKTIPSHYSLIVFFNVRTGEKIIFEGEDTIINKEIKLLVI